MPLYGDRPVVSDGEWQSEQPIELNSAAPFCVEVVGDTGVGGADNRENSAKFTMSEDISDAVPVVPPPSFSPVGLVLRS